MSDESDMESDAEACELLKQTMENGEFELKWRSMHDNSVYCNFCDSKTALHDLLALYNHARTFRKKLPAQHGVLATFIQKQCLKCDPSPSAVANAWASHLSQARTRGLSPQVFEAASRPPLSNFSFYSATPLQPELNTAKQLTPRGGLLAPVLSNTSDLIVWPPVLVLHNIPTETNTDGKRVATGGIGNSAVLAALAGVSELRNSPKIIFSFHGCRGVALQAFNASVEGYDQAWHLAHKMEQKNLGRQAWLKCQAPHSHRDAGSELYGYLATVEEMNKIDPIKGKSRTIK
mmetsp:Transcript_9509/g.12902  ORF Transcript_9509/g.12902 Transcript_9509/m.12902 type:complete len:290 (-) Transcript_9509:238-1107(-)